MNIGMDPYSEFNMYETYRNKNDRQKYDKNTNDNDVESFGSFITSISKTFLGQSLPKSNTPPETEFVQTEDDFKKNADTLYTQQMSNLNDNKKKGVKLIKKGATVTKATKVKDYDTDATIDDETFFSSVSGAPKQCSMPTGLIFPAVASSDGENIENKNISVDQSEIIKVKQIQNTQMAEATSTVHNTSAKDDSTVASKDVGEDELKGDDIFSYEDLLANLKLLSQVKKESKLATTSGSLDIDTRYSLLQPFQRWWSSDGKGPTYEILQKIIRSADFHSEAFILKLREAEDKDTKHKLQALTEDLITSRVGLRNLIITYRDCDSFLAKLDICWDAIAVRKEKNVNFRDFRK